MKESILFRKISDKFGIPLNTLKKEFLIRAKLLKKLFKNKVLSYEDVEKVINEYQKNHEKVLKRYNL